jgi:glycerol-3-phosphate acyltransferase PlsY
MTNLDAYDLLMVLAAYLVGGISTGYLLVRFIHGVDVRSTGSGGLGARNTGRILGRRGFHLTFWGDTLKGAAVVGAARWLEFDPIIVGAAVVAVIAGHIWPVWLKFRGGKGIATCLGAFTIFSYKMLLIGGCIFVILYVINRKKFLLSWVLTLLSLPLVIFFLEFPMYIVVSVLLSTATVVLAHKDIMKEAWL